MTGSTEAATELVERATLRRTLTAIQSLKEESRINYSRNGGYSFGSLEEEFQNLESTKGRVTANCLFWNPMSKYSFCKRDGQRLPNPSLLDL
jgi:hypothetical protein